MTTETQKAKIIESWGKVAPIAEQAAEIFYAKLFELDPSLRRLFKSDMRAQGAKLMKTIALAVASLNTLPTLLPILEDLGRRHVKYGVRREHYDTVGVALIHALRVGLGAAFTAETEQAWLALYARISRVMLDAAESEAPTSSLSNSL